MVMVEFRIAFEGAAAAVVDKVVVVVVDKGLEEKGSRGECQRYHSTQRLPLLCSLSICGAKRGFYGLEGVFENMK